MTIQGKTQASRIKDSDALLQILDLLPTSIFVKDENLNFVFSNEAHCKIIGSDAEKLLGFSDADFYPKDQAEKFLAADRSVLNSPEPQEFLEFATSTDGSTVIPAHAKGPHHHFRRYHLPDRHKHQCNRDEKVRNGT